MCNRNIEPVWLRMNGEDLKVDWFAAILALSAQRDYFKQ